MSAEPPPLDPARADESNLGWILGVNIAFHVLALVFVALRVYTRLFIVKTFGKDDFLLLIATVNTLCFLIHHCLLYCVVVT